MLMTHVLDENRQNYELKGIILDWLKANGEFDAVQVAEPVPERGA